MSKRLTVAIAIVFVLLTVFIFSVVITERINTQQLKEGHYYGGPQDVRKNIPGSEWEEIIGNKAEDEQENELDNSFLDDQESAHGNPIENALQNKPEGNYIIPPTDAKAYSYQESKVRFWIVRFAWSFLVPAFFIFSGYAADLMKWLERRFKRYVLVVIMFFILYSLIEFIIYLPLNYLGGYARAHEYGLSNQGFTSWLINLAKSFVVDTIGGAIIIWIPFLLIKKYPRRWWLYTGMLTIPVLIIATYISPIFIEPMFNKYTKINDTELEQKIQELVSKTTIGECQVFQVDKSTETKEMNAYMTGIFNTKRIVLWDTTIAQMEHKEVLSVVAHEMGHYLMGHIWKSIVLGGLLSILGLYFVNKIALWVLKGSNGTFGFQKLWNPAALPLLIIVINLVMFVLNPFINAYSRYIEKEADRFELELVQDNAATLSSTVKLYSGSLTLPRPGLVYKLWNYDHPTYEERVKLASTYKPWEENGKLKYEKYIILK